MPTQLTFDGRTLEAVLARVADEHGSAARILGAEKVRTGGLAGFFARERYEVMVELQEAVTDAGTDVPDPVGPSATPRSITELAEQVSEQERHAAPFLAPSRFSTPAAGSSGAVSTEGGAFQEVLGRLLADTALTSTEVQRLAPGSGRDPAGPPSPRIPASMPHEDEHPRVEQPTSRLVESLTALGVPQHLLVALKGAHSEAQQVLAALEQLLVPPPPLIIGRGDVVVVVGERGVAIEAAGVAASQLGQTPADVVVAGAGRAGMNSLRGPEDAAARRSIWRCCSPTVVAVCASDNSAGRAWVKEMIAALEPVTVWAAVRADRKPEDVTAWAATIGGVAALAVGACADTASPASMLATGLPIAAVEGRRSTPAAWTALLIERLAS